MRIHSLDTSTRRKLPDPNRLVVRSGEEVFAGGMKDQRSDPVVMPGLRIDSISLALSCGNG